MRFVFSAALFATLAFVAVANSITRPQQAVRLTPGQTYIYEYSSRLLTGIPELGDQFSGFEIKADLILQAMGDQVVAMKLSQITVGKHNSPVGNDFPQGDVTMDHQVNAQYQKELTKPIRFVYAEGKVKAFEADASEPEWSLNMKKAILSLLNVNLQPKKIIKSPKTNQINRPDVDLTVYPVYEEGIGGICETVYEINNVPDPKNPDPEQAFVLNVTKTRNYDNCLTEPTIVNDNYDVRGCPSVCRKEKSFAAVAGYYPTPDAVTDPYMSGCPCGKEPHESPVDAFNFVKYNISLQQSAPVIEGVYSEGKTSYQTNGDELIIITQQNLTLQAQGGASVSIAAIPRPQRHNELSFRIPKPVLPRGAKLPLDIPYYHLFGEPNVPELQSLIPELLDSLASDIVSGDLAAAKDSMQKTVQMVNAMAVLPQEALLSIFEEVAQYGQSQRATQKEQVIRKLYLDALPLAGSNPAAQFIAYLIQQNKVTTFEAKELVEAVPQNLFLIDTQTIDQYLELYQSPKVQARRHLAASAGIAFAKMVKEACVKRQSTPGDIPDDQSVPHPKRNLPAQMVVQSADPQSPNRVTVSQRTSFSQRMRRSVDWEDQFQQQDLCSRADVEKYVQIVARLLKQANTFAKKVALIEVLAHMGVPQALPVLEPYISGNVPQSECPGYVTESLAEQDEECDFIRQVAIYALAHISEHYPKQVAPLVLPVYADISEPYELRIAAFTTLVFADPEKQVLERIASELHTETNRQVRSFVYSSLETIGNITAPCFYKTAQYAAQAFQHAPHADYGHQYSKMMGHGFFQEDKDFGLYSVAEWVSNNISQVPRSAYFAIGQSDGPFQDNLVQMGFSAKGMESLVSRVLEPNGLIADMFESLNAKAKDRRVTKRNADSAQQALEALKSKLNLETRSDDEPKATVFFKLFDRTSYYALDKHYIHSVIDQMEDSIKDITQNLLQGQSYHYVKLVMPSQLYKVLPSEIGLPVVITHRHPTIVSVKVDQAKLQLEVQPKTVYPTGANITAQITPSLFYSSYTFAFAVNTADRMAYGSHVEKTTHVSLPVEISVGYSRPKNLLTWSVIPRIDQEIVYHKTESQTFIAKANIAGAPDRDWLQDSQPIRTMAVPFKHEATYGQEILGLGVRAQLNTENPWATQPLYSWKTAQEHGIAAAAIEAWTNPGLSPRELHIQLESDKDEPISGYDFTLRYKWISDEEETEDNDDSDESSQSDESDSDQSDESSSSQSSESKSSESNSSSNSKSSKSSESSEESDESNNKSAQLKRRIRNRMSKAVQSAESKRNRSKRSAKQETNESSDESSNESGSKSFSKSGSKESSQSSSSESDSSEEKRKNHSKNSSKYGSRKSNSQSAQSSESSSSSSSESDESRSMEDAVFKYEDVMKLILGQDFKKHNIKKITKELIHNTVNIWESNWDDDYDQSSSDQSNEDESTEVPQTIAHDIAVTAVARGPRPSYYAANVLYVHTFDHRIVWLKTDGHIKTPKGVYMEVPTLFCADAVIAYPTIPNEFYYEREHMQSQRARIQAQAGWGRQCNGSKADGGILVSGVMEQTEDQVITNEDLQTQEGATASHVQNWFYRQCQIDRAEGQSQSYACERAIIEDSYFNQLIVDIKYKNVNKELQNYTQKAALALKVALYDHLEVNALDVNNPDDQIRVVAQYSSRIPDIQLMNLLIKSPWENAQFERIHIPHARPVSSLLATQEVYSNLFSGYDNYDKCALMEDYVRTFDNVTFKSEPSNCQLLLAKDCSAKERFSVFAQQLDAQTKTKAVTVMTSGSEIKLLPPQQQNIAQVVVDGKAHEISFRKPVTIGAKNKNAVRIYLRATPSDAQNPIIVVESDINDLQIKYDGKNAKITVGAQYKGKMCGLCGDNNDETEDEFQGPDLCVYEDADDFFNSYALSGEHCTVAPHPKGQKRCPQKSFSSSESNEYGIHAKKEQKTVITPNGRTTLVRQQISQELSQQQRAAVIQAQTNAEEIQRQQQQQVENQIARQDGQPLSAAQEQALYAATPQQQKMIQKMRTQYIERDDMICFTTKPVLSCVQGRASQLKQVKADFHCLPKVSPFTQQLIQEAKRQAIKQLINKRVDLRQMIDVPVSCISA